MKAVFGILLGLVIALIGGFEAYRGSPLAPYVNGQMVLCIGLYFVLTSAAQRQKDFKINIREGFRGGAALLGLSAVYLIASQIIFNSLLKMPMASWDFYTYYTPIFHETLARLGAPLTYFLFFGMLLVMTPIGEELFYRGLLMRNIRSMGRTAAFVIPSLLFGIRHIAQLTYFWPEYPVIVGLAYGFFTFLMGLVLARIYEKTGSLVSCIIAHFMMNLILGPLGLLVFYGFLGHV